MDINSGGVDLQDYLELRDDRPLKFTAQQVEYRDHAEPGRQCEGCVHFYVNPRRNRSVCEIFRPAGDRNVNRAGGCRFFTTDGETFPNL